METIAIMNNETRCQSTKSRGELLTELAEKIKMMTAEELDEYVRLIAPILNRKGMLPPSLAEYGEKEIR